MTNQLLTFKQFSNELTVKAQSETFMGSILSANIELMNLSYFELFNHTHGSSLAFEGVKAVEYSEPL